MNMDELKSKLRAALINYDNSSINVGEHPEHENVGRVFARNFSGRGEYWGNYSLSFAVNPDELPTQNLQELVEAFYEVIEEVVPDWKKYADPESGRLPTLSPPTGFSSAHSDEFVFAAPLAVIEMYKERALLNPAENKLTIQTGAETSPSGGAPVSAVERLNKGGQARGTTDNNFNKNVSLGMSSAASDTKAAAGLIAGASAVPMMKSMFPQAFKPINKPPPESTPGAQNKNMAVVTYDPEFGKSWGDKITGEPKGKKTR